MEKNSNQDYISLQEAIKLCDYSQEYLSLRARQGKLKAVKIGRNWVTTREWLQDYLLITEEYKNQIKNNQNSLEPYLPKNLPVGEPIIYQLRLAEAPNFGGLRPVFVAALTLALLVGSGVLGKSSFSNIYKDISPIVQSNLQPIKEDISNLSVNFSQGISTMSRNIAKKFQSVDESITKNISGLVEEGRDNITYFSGLVIKKARDINEIIDERIENSAENALAAIGTVGGQRIFVGDVSVTVKEIVGSTSNIFGDYSRWVKGQIEKNPLSRGYLTVDRFLEQKLSQDIKNLKSGYLLTINTINNINNFIERQLSKDIKKLKESYLVINDILEKKNFAINNFFEKKISGFGTWAFENYWLVNDLVEQKLVKNSKALKERYLTANDFIEDKIFQGKEKITGIFKKTHRFFTVTWRERLFPEKELKELSGEKLVEKEEFDELKFKELKLEIEKIKKEPVVIKRIEVEKVVEPVKEITREVETVKQITKVDDEALKQVRANITYLEGEIAKRLYAPGGVVSQTIYVTEPVSSPKIYQENGEIVLQTVGSGNVILSAATGLQLYGQQIVIDSTSIQNPMVYIADQTRIDGPVTAQRISLSPPSNFTGPVLTVGGADGTKFSVNQDGAASLVGNFTITGNIAVSGSQTYSGATIITASSTASALQIQQNGSGLVAKFLNGSGTSLFTIAIDGSITANATITAASFASAENNSTVRKSGEEVFREILPISRYDIPAQTSTTTYFRISKYFSQNPLSSTPEPLPGATRVYKLIIKYADDISLSSSSSWRIWQSSAQATSSTFTLLGQNLSSFGEGIATTTQNLTIPDTDWQVEMKLPSNDKTIRIFQIFLAAFDRIN